MKKRKKTELIDNEPEIENEIGTAEEEGAESKARDRKKERLIFLMEYSLPELAAKKHLKSAEKMSGYFVRKLKKRISRSNRRTFDMREIKETLAMLIRVLFTLNDVIEFENLTLTSIVNTVGDYSLTVNLWNAVDGYSCLDGKYIADRRFGFLKEKAHTFSKRRCADLERFLFAACDDYFPEGVTDNIGQSLEARKIRSLYRVDPITLEECANIQRKSDESDFERMLKGDGGEGDAVGEGDEKEDGGQDGSEDDSEDEDEDGSDDTFNILSPFLSPRERLLQRRQERLKRLYDDDSDDDDDTPLQLPEASLKDILKELDKKVIGQEEAKHTVALAIRDHLVRIKNSDKKINKTNIILCGPSGCGKTEIARTVSAYLKVPMIVEDITTFTETGYKGRDFIEILDDLLCAADGNVAKAQIGIVYLDEFDKLGARSGDSNHDNHQLSTQNGLLKLAEGAVYNLKRDVTFDTSNVLFIASGCFPNLTSPEKVKKKAAIGFSASERESVDATEYSSPEGAEKITAEMLVKSGFLLELIGRFPVIARLESLSVNDVVRIIREPENSVLEQYRSLYGCMGVDLNFSDEMLTDIAKRAVGQNIGARGLKTVFEEVIRSVAFDIPEEPATVDFYLADDGSYAHTVTLKPKEKPCPVTVCRGDGIGDGIDDGNIDG